MKKSTLEKAFIERTSNNLVWEETNKILYDLCKKDIQHKNNGLIIAKLFLIGRSYAAAIERGAGGVYLDELYQKTADLIQKSSIADDMQHLSLCSSTNIKQALDIHYHLMQLLPPKNGRRGSRRSLASKYLHFHCPDRF